MSISSLRPCQIIPLEKIYTQSNKIIKLFLLFDPFCYNPDPFGMKFRNESGHVFLLFRDMIYAGYQLSVQFDDMRHHDINLLQIIDTASEILIKMIKIDHDTITPFL